MEKLGGDFTIDFTQLRSDILKELNNHIAPTKAIIQDQNGPRPQYPFLTCKFSTPYSPQQGQALETGKAIVSNNLDFKFDYQYTREEQPKITISITAYSETLDEAETKAMLAYRWFDFIGYEYLKEKDLIVVDRTDIQERDTLIIDDYERRKGFDVVLRTVDTDTRVVETIESVIVTGKQIGRASCRERVSSPV